ncbi:MAG: hypothetical protein V9F04_04535 [Dermatophilaceae bacterium]
MREQIDKPINEVLRLAIENDPRSVSAISRESGISRTYMQAASVGYRIVDGNTRVPLSLLPATVARMAKALGIPAQVVREAGEDAAADLMEIDPPLSQASTAQLAEELNKRLHGQSSD